MSIFILSATQQWRERAIMQDAHMVSFVDIPARYEADSSYRPPQLKKLVEKHGWNALDVGI